MTAKQLATRIRRFRGKVEAPVLVRNDVHYLIVEKADLIDYLTGYGNEPSPMTEVGVYSGVLRIDASLKGE